MKITIEDENNKTTITTKSVVENGKQAEKININFVPELNKQDISEQTDRLDALIGLHIVNLLVKE